MIKKNIMNFIFLRFGFTVLEALISIAIIFIVAVAGSSFVIESLSFSTFEEEQSTAVQNARNAAEVIIREARETNFSDHGEYALSIISPQEFVFYSDVDDDEKMDKVKYYLEGLFLKRSVTPPGPANDYSGPATVSTLAQYISNGENPVFIYYNQNNQETEIKQEVRMLRIIISADVDPENAPLPYVLESDIHLRNLKDNF